MTGACFAAEQCSRRAWSGQLPAAAVFVLQLVGEEVGLEVSQMVVLEVLEALADQEASEADQEAQAGLVHWTSDLR